MTTTVDRLKHEIARLTFRETARGRVEESLLDDAWNRAAPRLTADDYGKVNAPSGFASLADFIDNGILFEQPAFRQGATAAKSTVEERYGLSQAQINALLPEDKIALSNAANRPKGLK